MSHYILVVDTEQYSGNFEREMCAYITGQTGECGVGEELLPLYSSDILNLDWWSENIQEEPDDHGYYRPVAIYPTEGWVNDGMGKFFKEDEFKEKSYPAYLSVAIFMNEKPPEEVINEFLQRAQDFCKYRPDLDENLENTVHKDALTFTGVRLLEEDHKVKVISKFDTK